MRMMTVHKLSAGDGYAYYTQEVASGDELRRSDRELGDYYTVEGMPPGQWIGHSQELLGVSGDVTEDQMKALYGEGLHPDADALMRGEVSLTSAGLPEVEGQSVGVRDVELGSRYKHVSIPDNAFTRRYAEEVLRYQRVQHRAPNKDAKAEIRGRVAGQVFRETHGRDAANSAELGRFITAQTKPKQQAVAGYDLVFSPSKSVSLLWALGGDDARRAVEAAHEDAIRDAVGFLEDHATYTRRGANGVRQVDVDGGLVATKFRHYDSRTGDPQLHDHVVVANKVKGTDGKWSSLDGRQLYKMGVSASEVYNQRVIENVCKRLDVSAVERSTGADQTVLEIAGISDAAIDRASGRRASITEELDRLSADFQQRHGYAPNEKQRLQLAQQATLATRPEKKEARRLSDLVSDWQGEYSRDVGIPVGPELLEHARQFRRSNPEASLRSTDDHARHVVHALSQKRSTWGLNHVRAEAVRQLGRESPGGRVSDQMIDSVVHAAAHEHSLSASPQRTEVPDLPEFRRADGTSQFVRADADLFTSTEVIQAEHRVLDAAQRTVVPHVHAEHFRAAESAHTGPLNDAQRDVARAFACDDKLFTVAVGPAGTGKTTSLGLAADAIRAADRQVIGLAPTAAAASVMGQDMGAEATTIDAFLMDKGRGIGPSQLRPGDVLIVDEVGMVTTPKLAELLDHAQRSGAQVRGIGDDRQLGAIGSGGALRLVTNEVGARRLDEVHRFRTPGEDAASLALREPSPTAADDPWTWYKDAGRVVAGDTDVMTSAALRAWAEDTAEGKTSLLVASDNATVADLNARAQAMRQATGELDPHGRHAVLADHANAWTGDVVVTRKNDRRLTVNNGRDFVKNGDTWTVQKVHRDGSAVLRHQHHGGQLTMSPSYLAEHTQLGYAASIHRAQGATVDTAHAILDERTDRTAAYVATSRGRESNRVYVALATPEQSRDDVLDTIAAAYDRDLPAHEAVIEQTHAGTSLAELGQVYAEVDASAFDRRIEAIARERLGDANTDMLTERSAWGAITANLRSAEDSGLDAGTILERSWTERSLTDAHDPAAVMAWRIERRTEDARAQLAAGGDRPLSHVSDDFLDRAIDRAPASEHFRLDDPEWGKRPYAWIKTDDLNAQVQAAQAPADQTPSGLAVQAMSAELGRRRELSPGQRRVEQMSRGDRPRSGHDLTLHHALRQERETRAWLAPQAEHSPAQKGISEALAPTRRLTDQRVPSGHREALEKLRARMELRAQTRGAELAEKPPQWADALGPVPAKPAQRSEWHQVAAEVEAYRDRYRVPAHEPELIPRRFTDEASNQLRTRATALHKHSALTTKPPASDPELRDVADVAATAERATRPTTPAQAAIDAHRADRSRSGDLPSAQRRAHSSAEHVAATTSDAGSDDFVAAAIARARRNSPSSETTPTQQAQPAADSTAAFAAAVADRHKQSSSQKNQKKETPVSEAASQQTKNQALNNLRSEQARKYSANRSQTANTKRTQQAAESSRKAAQQAQRAADRSRQR